MKWNTRTIAFLLQIKLPEKDSSSFGEQLAMLALSLCQIWQRVVVANRYNCYRSQLVEAYFRFRNLGKLYETNRRAQFKVNLELFSTIVRRMRASLAESQGKSFTYREKSVLFNKTGELDAGMNEDSDYAYAYRSFTWVKKGGHNKPRPSLRSCAFRNSRLSGV